MRVDFRHYVDERTRNYTSRPWLIEEIAAWLRDPGSSRYFFLTGEPGSGKTALTGYLWLLSSGALPPGEAHVPPGSIAAHHFCFARDLQSITPAVFAESIAEQLATAIPAFDEVRRQPYQKDLGRIDSTITVFGANTGQITGVAFPHEGDAESAFAQLVRTPLEKLYAQGFDRDLFILVDALDEARQFSGKRNIADLVTLAEGMRSRVRFLLTSRPDTELLARLPVDARRHIDLSDAAVRERTRVDVRRHLGRSIAGDDAIRGKLAGGISETLFVSMLADKADGNFLWTRIVLDIIRDHDGPVTAAVLDALPSGLHNTYLGLLRRIAPDAAQWQDGPAALVFGTLAVALEELTLPQLAAYTGVPGPRLTFILEQAFQLLDVSPPEGGGTYAIYHRSLVDFLLEPAADHTYALDPLDQHRRIADAWIGQIGPGPRWEDSDGYTLRHISAHLFALRQAEPYAAWLQRLVCREWRELKETKLRTDVSFANDVTLAVDAASEAWPRQLVEQLFGIAVLTTVRSRGENLPEAGLTLLVRLGRRAEALAYAEMRPAPGRAWIAIAETLVEEDPSTAESLARRAIEAGNDANEALAILVRALGRLARFDEARQLLASPTLADKHAARETLAGHAVAAGQLDVAEEIAETVEKGYTHSATVAKIVLAAAARRDWTRVQRLFAALAGDQRPYDLVENLLEQSAGAEAEIVAILREHGTEEDLERARRAAQRFAEADDDERALAAAAALNDDRANRMVRSARIRQIAGSGDAAQIAAFRAGASDDEIAELDEVRAMAFVIAGREADAALVLQQTPDRRRVTAAVLAMLRRQQDVNVTALLDAMGDGASDEWFTDAAQSAAWSRDFTLGKELAARISHPAQRARAAGELAHAALKEHDASLAEQIWRELAPQGPAPSGLVTAVAKSGRLDDALALLAGLTWGWREAAVDVAERLVAAQRIDDALRLASTAAASASDRNEVAGRVMAAVARQAPEHLASVVARIAPSGWDLRDAIRFTVQHDVEAGVRLAQFADWDRIDILRDAALDRLDEGDVNGATVLTNALFQAPRRFFDPSRMLDLVEAFAVAGHPDEAIAFAREAGMTLAEAQVIVAEVESDSGDIARAKAVVAEALHGDAVPEPAVAAKAAYVLARLGDSARAAELCRQVTRDAAPRAVILRAWAACGLTEEAAVLNDGSDYERNVGRTAIAAGLAARDDSAGARAVLAEIDGSISWDRHAVRDVTRLTIALLPPNKAAAVFLRAGIADGRLLAGLAGSAAVEHAAATVEAMEPYAQETAFAEALPRLAARGDWRAATILAMAMTNRVEAWIRLLVVAVTVRALPPALVEVRKLADGNDTAFALRRAAKSVEGAAAEALLAEVPDEEPPSAAQSVEQWIAVGDHVRAIELAMRLEEDYSRKAATVQIVAAAAERDGIEAALRFAAYDEAARFEVIADAALKLAREGKGIAADLILTLSPDDARWRVEWIAEELAAHRNLDAALRIADTVRGRDRPRTLKRVVSGTAKHAPDRALELALQIEEPESRISALADVAVAHAERGEGELAFELATSPRLGEASTADFTSIAVALLEAGRRDLSERLLDRAIFAANSVTDPWRRNFVFRLLCDHALDRGDVTSAQTFAAGILPASVCRADTLVEIARAQAETGRREAARATLRSVLTSLTGLRSDRRLTTELDAAATLVALDGSAGIVEVKQWCRESQHGARRVQALVQLTERQLAGRIRHFSSLPSSVRSGTTRRDRVVQPFVRLVQRYRVADLAKTAEGELAACDSESERIIALGWLVYQLSTDGRARRVVAAAREIRDFALPRRPTDTRSIVLSQAAIALRRAGEEDESRAITEELLRTLRYIGDPDELRVAVDWIALIASRFGDGDLAEALVRAVWQKNRHRAADTVNALANRLQKPEERIRVGRVLADLATATDGADADDVVAILQCAGTDETLIDAAEYLAHRTDGEDALAAFCEGAVLLARNHSVRVARWIALAGERGKAAGIEPLFRVYVAAKVAAAQSELGLRDEALASLGDVFRDGRLYDRDAFFDVLDVVIPALHRVDAGETLSRVARRIVESESWWNHRLVEQ